MSPDPESHITWFDEDDWIGTEIVFETPHASRWRVDQKLAESEDCVTEFDVQQCNMQSSARGVFVCSSIDDPGKEAAVKIRMQAEQAKPEVRRQTENEVCALKRLTAAGCSSTPAFFAWKHEIQGDDGWVPGGYIDYILMERVPGSRPKIWSPDMDREERDELRRAFKPAWIETIACGLVHDDSAIRNVVWHRDSQKCYIVDWELWNESTDKHVWDDTEYISWNMARARPSNYGDMSTWVL